MEPRSLSIALRRIASAIDNSRNPSRVLVARDLKSLVLRLSNKNNEDYEDQKKWILYNAAGRAREKYELNNDYSSLNINIKIATNQDYQDKYRKKINEIYNEDLPYKEERAKIQEAIKIILEEMLLDNKFEKIFKTSKGSIYFLDENKECLRIKSNEKGELEFQPITKDLFFINKNDLENLKNSLKALPLIEIEVLSSGQEEDRLSVSLAEYEIGSIPIEINVKSLCAEYGRDRLIKYKKEDGKLIFNATKIDENKKPSDIHDFFADLFGGFHYGHEITEIIK